jgi:hypothetical protein
MTESRRKTKIILLQRNMTFAHLAKAAGLAEATIHNVLDGKASSAKSKQAITNALGAEVFEGVRVTARPFTIPAGTKIDWGTEAEAIAAEKEFAGFIKRRNTTISFIKPVPAWISEPEPSGAR